MKFWGGGWGGELSEHKAEQCLPEPADRGQGNNLKGSSGAFWGDRHILYHDCIDGAMTIHLSKLIELYAQIWHM